MSEAWLILETSGRGGRVGLALGGAVVRTAELDPARRHNRDLAPALSGMLDAEGIAAKALHGVMVSVGPGSFTGLRVGVMSAKALAYATGCRLVAVPTFAAMAEQCPPEVSAVDAIADGLQGTVFAQRFRRDSDGWQSASELTIEPVATWAARLSAGAWVTGPGVDLHDAAIPSTVNRVEDRVLRVESVFRVGSKLPPLDRDEMLRLEPLYLRLSSAEEKAMRDGK
jgi:tRNA threonylcarbamoyladenosine biosynthesis protein TsaB